MAKLSAWLITIIGVLLVLPLLEINDLQEAASIIIPLFVLILGVSKLMRNYNYQIARGRRR